MKFEDFKIKGLGVIRKYQALISISAWAEGIVSRAEGLFLLAVEPSLDCNPLHPCPQLPISFPTTDHGPKI